MGVLRSVRRLWWWWHDVRLRLTDVAAWWS